MAIQSFYRPRKPRVFEHKYIYFDPAKEAKERRYERLRNELIDRGELDGEKTHRFDSHQEGEVYSSAKRLRGQFVGHTEHLQRQVEAGITRHDRRLKMIRLMLMLLGLGFILWYFFLKF